MRPKFLQPFDSAQIVFQRVRLMKHMLDCNGTN